MESLSYLTTKFFEPRVICANPGGTCNRIADTIRFLRRNFEREERMMDVVACPEAVRHRKEHKELLRRLTRMRRTLVCSGYDNAVLFDLITDWQKNHIPRFDEPLGKRLREFEMNSAKAKRM
jgi:hemerythrin